MSFISKIESRVPDILPPPNPEIVDCRVSGFGVRGSRNSGLNISNFIDLPKFPKSRAPTPKTRQSTISGFGGPGTQDSICETTQISFKSLSPPNPEIVDCRVSGFGVRGSRNSGLNISNFIDLPKFPKSRAPTPNPRDPAVHNFGVRELSRLQGSVHDTRGIVIPSSERRVPSSECRVPKLKT
ncbi:hypothetical protein EV424DRAFT_1342848 [Suillus variegatus]|nr:hypothetical protein EV424DRAFT_1342848 [Suillus variegatus]